MAQAELEHYGILGMKWGVRRTPEQLGHKTKAAKEREHYKKFVDSRYDYSMSSVSKAIKKYPDTKSFRAEKNQAERYKKEELSKLNQMNDDELEAQRKAAKVGHAKATAVGVAGLAGTAAGLAAAASAPFNPAVPLAIGTSWIGGVGGSIFMHAKTAGRRNGPKSDWGKKMAAGNQFIMGMTTKYGAYQIERKEKEARKTGEPMKLWTGGANYTSTMSIPLSLIDKYAKKA